MEEAKSLIHQQLMLQQQAQLQQQEQLSLFQQQKQHHQQMQQQAMSRFPSNIDVHLIPPGLRNNNPLNPQPPHQHHSQQQPNPNPNPNPNPILNSLLQQQQQQQQQQQKKPIRAPPANQPEMQMAYQDAWRVCHPEFNHPFKSLEDACDRLLPYHVVADYEAEEDDRILESDTTGQILSRSQQWDNNIAAKVAEFTATFEKQVLAFNIISRKRAIGEFRSEERLMLEQALLQEEKQALFELKTEMESREKASREAQLRMAAAMVQSEQARGVGPLRGSAVGSQGGSDHDMSEREHGVHNPEEMMNGWGHSVQREDREPSEDFLNDEETDNGETSGHHEWREVGEFDLNTR